MKAAKFFGMAAWMLLAASAAAADVQTVNGKRVECVDGVCRLVDAPAMPAAAAADAPSAAGPAPRIAHGYMPADEFIAFLERRESNPLRNAGIWMTLLLVLLGGLAMNLTPCVLPMIPVNLMIIGRSAKRGAAYGLGMAASYGALGIAAAAGGMAFGAIQSSPWFNLAVALVFLGLALATFGVFAIDLSRFRPAGMAANRNGSLIFPFIMGSVAAVLAGACVAPVLISVLLLTADWMAAGRRLALLLPLVLGLGMALPWPLAGAGLKVLPKPGGWMKWVNRVFGVAVLGFAVRHGLLAVAGWREPAETGASAQLRPAELPETIRRSPRPLLVDCWASWCKNCAAMDRVLAEDGVRSALASWQVVKVQAEDLEELRKIPGFEGVRGLPAFVVFE